jgi:ABC-type uncharacterized transport system permease subunit
MQLYLGKMNFYEGVRGLVIEVLWLVILYVCVKMMWKIGVKKKYEGIGI